MIEIANIKTFNKAIGENTFTLAYFTHKKCGVCASIKPRLEEISKSLHQIKFINIDIEKNPEIAGQNTIFTAPVLLLFNNKKEVLRYAGNFGISQLKHDLERLSKF